MDIIYDVIIIGGGPSGFSCGIYAARALLKTLIITSPIIPPQAVLTDIIENYPGFEEGINGFDLIEKLKNQSLKFGCNVITAQVESLKKEKVFEIKTDNNQSFFSRSVVVAVGRSNKKLGLENENRLIGKGISYCAVCDAMFYKDKIVAVIGGGDTAFTEAIYLTKFVKKLYLIHRRKEFRATKILQKRLFEKNNVEIFTPYVVLNFLEEEKLSGIVIKNLDNQNLLEIKCDGVFICIGHRPNTDFIKDIVVVDQDGYIITDENMETKVKGIFACGDCRSGSVKQVVAAAYEGVKAALSVIEFLENQK